MASAISTQDRQRLTEQRIAFLDFFYKLLQMVRIHQDNNHLLLDNLKRLMGISGELLLQHETIAIQLSHSRFYIQEEKLPFKGPYENLFQNLLAYFEKRDIHGIRFYNSLGNKAIEEMLVFARLLNRSERQPDPHAWLENKIQMLHLNWIEMIVKPETEGDAGSDDTSGAAVAFDQKKEAARRVYFYALDSIKDVARKISSQKRVATRYAIRTLQNMVDLITEDEMVLMGMSTIKDYDDYTYAHSVNVAILSMFLGKFIKLSRKAMLRLGTCGLFHDLGKIDVPLEILNKPDKLNASEATAMQRHSLFSVRQILKLETARDFKAKIILPPFEHHLRLDLSGYPKSPRKKPISLFGRIITIVDVFDAITTPRVYRPYALSPDRALGRMMRGAGSEFDPILLKAFINMMGMYPMGTLLQLDNQQMGLVVDASGDYGRRPKVVLLLPKPEGGFTKGPIVDLAEIDPQSGQFQREIVASDHPANFNIQPAEFIT